MKRVLTALALTVAGLAAVLGFKTRDPAAASPGSAEAAAGTTTTAGAAVTSPGAAPTTTAAAGATTTTSAGTTATTTPAASTATIEGDGPVVDTRYGPVQVSVVVTDGQLVDVIALQLPSGDRTNVGISSYAEPLLREMALEAQSADIDVVSGATFTSRAYAESLQGALDAAGL